MSDTVNEALLKQESSTIINNINSNDDVEADITITVDTDNGTTDPVLAANIVESNYEDKYDNVESNVVYVSSSPTTTPSLVPSEFPTTNIPTASPSFTGIISLFFCIKSIFLLFLWGLLAGINLEKDVTKSLTPVEIAYIQSSAAFLFGVTEDDLKTDIVYSFEGTVDIDTKDTDTNVAEDELQQAIADMLGIHPNKVDVSINPDSGVASFKVTSDNAEDLIDMQNTLKEVSVPDILSNDNITVSNVQVVDTVKLDVDMQISLDNATKDDGYTIVEQTCIYLF